MCEGSDECIVCMDRVRGFLRGWYVCGKGQWFLLGRGRGVCV